MSQTSEDISQIPAKTDRPWPGRAEFVGLIALLMAINAFSIDIVLPALGVIADDFGEVSTTQAQSVVTLYVMFFGIGQLAMGPFVDRFGRRPLLLLSVFLFALANIFAAMTASFEMLLVSRAAQGVTAAALRVVALSVVRDRYSGRTMAKVMSIVMMVFMVVPLLAPALGQGLLALTPWHGLFYASALVGMIAFVWVMARLPESLPRAARRKVSPTAIIAGYGIVLRSRQASGYMIAKGFVFGILFSYVVASNQIYLETYTLGVWFPLAFSSGAAGLAVSNFVNSRLVEAFGMRALSHTALAVMLIFGAIHSGFALAGYQPLWLFMVLTIVPFVMLGFVGANFTALALDPVGEAVGIATSLQGFIATGVAGFLGGLVAAQFDGTAAPYAYGTTLLSLIAVLVTVWTERGRFRAFRFVRQMTD